MEGFMRKWSWIIGLAALVALTGCIKMDQDITLKKDGSGNVKFMYGMSEQTINQMKAMSQMGAEEGVEVESDDDFEFDEKKVRAKFEEYKDQGITLKSVKSETKDGWKYMHIDFDFQDIAKLNEAGVAGDSPINIAKNSEGNYVVTSKMGGGDMGMEDADAEQMKAMLPMLAGMRIALKVTTPTKIISTTAPVKTENSAEWVYDADTDPDSILKMGQTKMEIVFDGTGVTIPEIK
jgi:hypothetical protein